MLKPEIKEQWITALTDGSYAQARRYLRNKFDTYGESFCCLGVLCDLYRKETGEGEWKGDSFFTGDERQSLVPTPTVLAWAGFEHVDDVYPLTNRNDGDQEFHPHSFEEIATFIKESL